ncbi:MAG TPA: bifunctional riboflavin kinase/FAD synthetase [Candidatus Acidoferrales bacterium]|nr:bifunctional riboflavin kinase/FAD synthetase [Candidatus Acidoferrales bacterium]
MSLAIAHSAEEWAAHFGKSRKPAAVAIGNFDGLHLGHQAILGGVLKRAREAGWLAAVLTLYPHPPRVLQPAKAPLLLSSLSQRLAGFEAMGLDAALVVEFNHDLSKLSPEEFAQKFLAETMRAKAVFVGENFRFGHKQSGDVKLLGELGKKLGFEACIVAPVKVNGEIVSSTTVRQAVSEGRMDAAARLLGRPYSIAGEIHAGTGQGRKLVVPTLNIATEQELLPKKGVYVTETLLGGRRFPSVTNVGVRPTFDGAGLSIESHLLDFNEAITAGKMEIRFLARLRDEQKFASVEALKKQVLEDIDTARRHFTRV